MRGHRGPGNKEKAKQKRRLRIQAERKSSHAQGSRTGFSAPNVTRTAGIPAPVIEVTPEIKPAAMVERRGFLRRIFSWF